MNINVNNLFIISNFKNAWSDKFDLQNIYPTTEVDEDDYTQFIFGTKCKHFILSESIFHLWISYLGTINNKNKKVLYFKNTDFDLRPLVFDDWLKIDS